MSDGFVQQHARPAVAQNNGHFACGRRAGFEINQGLFDGGIDKVPHEGFIEISQVVASATTRTALLSPVALFGDNGNVQAHHRTNIRRVSAIKTGDVNHVVFAGQPRHHLHNARIGGFCKRFHFIQQGNFGGGIETDDGIQRRMNGFAVCNGRYFDRSLATCRTNNADGLGGAVDRIDTQTVRIGKSGFFTRNSAHTHTLIDLETA